MKYFLLAVLLSFTFSLASDDKPKMAPGSVGIFRCHKKKPKKICVTNYQLKVSADAFQIHDGWFNFYTNDGPPDYSHGNYPEPEPVKEKCIIEIIHHKSCTLVFREGEL